MRILANENFPRRLVVALRDSGHDVIWIREVDPGVSDSQVLDRAQCEERIVATFDKDFGALAFRAGLPASCGVILVRIRADSPDDLCDRVLAVLQRDSEWQGHFATVETDRVRLRALPHKRS